MACAEEIYRFTLEQLAESGNEQAKLALAMAGRLGRPAGDPAGAIKSLQYAQERLARALSHNDQSWNRSTDARIHEAQAAITEAIVKFK